MKDLIFPRLISPYSFIVYTDNYLFTLVRTGHEG